jgi:hypothetical protein
MTQTERRRSRATSLLVGAAGGRPDDVVVFGVAGLGGAVAGDQVSHRQPVSLTHTVEGARHFCPRTPNHLARAIADVVERLPG